MGDEFIKSVEDRINLWKRVYSGKDRSVTPPKPISQMDKSHQSYLPTAPMIYAVIPDPSVVDILSYQPHIDGGSNLSVKVRLSHKLQYQDGQLHLILPFSFPSYVTPAGKKMSKKEKIQLDINSGPGTEVVCKMISHPLKELRREGGKLGFFYKSQILTWSTSDFIFTYEVSTNSFANVILQSPSVFDIDQRDMFCLSIYIQETSLVRRYSKRMCYLLSI
ncbi:hypothetical protein POM88_006822 [Heracleum sosnowskyi]|uniref:Uncharacterized protein n=1 Tax=Heracleum sosnowskyi TaxID=360622 RepID=A0AAD8J4Z0_9APIA|nr:hypothetical protein POM88_006822 [Heracleum sosnowskyi]